MRMGYRVNMLTGRPEDMPLALPGYAIVLTLINNIGASKTDGGKVAMVAFIQWPDTPEGERERDAAYDAFPAHPKRTNRRFEASIDRVTVGSALSSHPAGLVLEQTRRIPPVTAELLLGCTLSDAFAAVHGGAATARISPEELAEALS